MGFGKCSIHPTSYELAQNGTGARFVTAMEKKGKERVSQEETISELARNFSFVLPHIKHSILSGKQAGILWSKEKPIKGGRVRLSHQKGSREVSLFLFGSDQEA